MESTSEFVEIFLKNCKERNGCELERLFKEGPKYLQSLSTTEIGILLEDFMNEECLPKYLHSELDKPKIEKDLEPSLREAFTLLKYLLTEFPDHYRPHLEKTFDICTFALRNKTSYYIKRASRQALRALIVNFPDYTTGMNDFTNECIKKRAFYVKNELSMILQVLCTIARHHPDLPAITSHGKKIQLLVLNRPLQRLQLLLPLLTLFPRFLHHMMVPQFVLKN